MARNIQIEKRDIRGAIFTLGLLSAIMIHVGCNDQNPQGKAGSGSSSPTPTPTATPSPTPSPTATATPASTEEQLFTLQVNFPTVVFAPFHLHDSSAPQDWSKSCKVDTTPTNSTSKDVLCIAEVGQLDLWDNDFTVNWTAPIANCSYVIQYPYWFSQWEPGMGSTRIAYDTDAAGVPFNLTCDNDGDGDIDGADSPCTIATIKSSGTSSAVTCKYDHSKNLPLAGPNCCEGFYQQSVTASGTTTVSVANWGGQWGNCASGPAALESTIPRDQVHRLPMGLITQAYGGATGSLAVKAPQDRLNSSVMSVANYHSNPTPSPTPTPTQNPLAPINGTLVDSWGTTYNIGNQYYQFACFDAAYAMLGRIRMMVRKWNLQAELNKNGTGDWTLTNPTATPFPMPWRTLKSWEEFTGPTPTSSSNTFPSWGL